MVKAFVLIWLLVAPNGDIATGSQEFFSETDCNTAKAELPQIFRGFEERDLAIPSTSMDPRRGTYTAKCVEK
jgi:hypothetical protein